MELDALAAGRRYERAARLEVQLARVRPRVVESLRGLGVVRPGEHVLGPSQGGHLGDRAHPGGLARAWCPTPSARRLVDELGYSLGPVPDVDVLATVNHRAFSAALGPTLPGERFAETWAEVADAVAAIGGEVLLKRAFGVAGRGQRIVRGEPDERDRRWFAASPHGVQVEPRVAIGDEFVVHGWIAGAQVRVGEPRLQEIEDRAWVRTTPLAGQIADEERNRLVMEARRVGSALVSAGYFGPFGIDAFRFAMDGELRWRWRSEINARYTTAWSAQSLAERAMEPA